MWETTSFPLQAGWVSDLRNVGSDFSEHVALKSNTVKTQLLLTSDTAVSAQCFCKADPGVSNWAFTLLSDFTDI